MSIMKKFNFFAIAAIALTSVFGLTSCEKDEPFDNAPAPYQPKVEVSGTTGTDVNTNNNGYTNTIQDKDVATVKETTAKDVAGTYKFTAEDGKEWIIEFSENAGSSEGNYSASITVPDGEEVAPKTYDGEYKIMKDSAFFYSTETVGSTFKNSIVSFMLTINNANPNNTSVSIKFNGETLKSFVFAKQ